ncbi:hypothetical protein PRIPAC_76123 [Pristionchus pacificus]|nr:hypothetical protein PRIPAC_76123 [Pristionchus pacificus]
MPQLIKGIRPMHIAFFVTLIVIIVVAVTLAVVLSINNEQEKVPSITVSLYVGDIDEPKNGRRKRATGDDECMRLEDVKYTVRDILSKLAQEGNVQKVRFLTYSDASYITEAMPLDMGISQLANIVMLRDGKAPKQSS